MSANCISVNTMSERVCGNPARTRRGMCEHEHLREGPICDRCARVSWCSPCYEHPASPHACPVRFENGRP